MPESPYLSEIFRIVEGAVHLDKDKVRNYAELLAEKLDGDGEKTSARRLRKIVQERSGQLRPSRVERKKALPVDTESRFPLVEEIPPDEAVGSFVFTQEEQASVEEFLGAVTSRDRLENAGIDAGTNLLLYGPPGCGKSHLAAYIAHALSLPMFIARLDGLISSFLGSTSKNIRAVMEFASRTPCVLLLDEFDAIAKLRDDHQELGELKRVVNSFIQNLDNLGSGVVLVAATNHHQLLDKAVWRRFDYLLCLDYPAPDQRAALWDLYAGELGWSRKQRDALADLSTGFSCAAIQAVSMRLRQRVVTGGEEPNLRNAVELLCSLSRGQMPEGNPLSPDLLSDPKVLTHALRERSRELYSFELIGDIAGYSKATVSRFEAELTKDAARSKQQGRKKNATKRRTAVHKGSPAKSG